MSRLTIKPITLNNLNLNYNLLPDYMGLLGVKMSLVHNIDEKVYEYIANGTNILSKLQKVLKYKEAGVSVINFESSIGCCSQITKDGELTHWISHRKFDRDVYSIGDLFKKFYAEMQNAIDAEDFEKIYFYDESGSEILYRRDLDSVNFGSDHSIHSLSDIMKTNVICVKAYHGMVIPPEISGVQK
jgi:hypothetical protein